MPRTVHLVKSTETKVFANDESVLLLGNNFTRYFFNCIDLVFTYFYEVLTMKTITKRYSHLNTAILVLILGALTCPTPTLAEAGAKSLFSDGDVSISMDREEQQQTSSASSNIKYAGLQYWIDLQEDGTSRRVTTSHPFHSGDGIKLQIKSNTEGYLYVLNEDASGQQTTLYPAKGQQSGLIQPGSTYTIPTRGAIRFDNQPGREKIIIALAKQPANYRDIESSSVRGTTAAYDGGSAYDNCRSSGAGSKAMFNEDSSSSTNCTPSNNSGAGSKGMFSEEDTTSAEPASYSVMPVSALQNGRIMSVEFNLTHR